MSVVDRAKVARGRVIDRLHPDGLVFHHVPKCGGTSVGRAVRRAYAGSQATIRPGPSRRARDTVSDGSSASREVELVRLRAGLLAYHLHCDVRCVAAHVPFSARIHDEFADRYRFAVVLRDPVARFVSHFLHISTRPGRPRRFDDLEGFLSSASAVDLGRTYARYLCGEALEGRELDGRGVEMAVANLGRLAVGFTDDLGRFESDLRRLTGKRIHIGRENVGGTDERRDAILDGPLRSRLEELCRPDRDIWEAAQRLR